MIGSNISACMCVFVGGEGEEGCDCVSVCVLRINEKEIENFKIKNLILNKKRKCRKELFPLNYLTHAHISLHLLTDELLLNHIFLMIRA